MTTISYTLKYQVLADSRLAAIMQAGGKVRRGVRVVELLYADPGIPGYYDVGLAVEEDIGADDPPEPEWDLDAPDPIDVYKADLVRWGP